MVGQHGGHQRVTVIQGDFQDRGLPGLTPVSAAKSATTTVIAAFLAGAAGRTGAR